MSIQEPPGGVLPSRGVRAVGRDVALHRSPAARRAMLEELDRRGAGGIYIYLPCFVAVAVFCGLYTSAPLVSATSTAAFLALGIARFVLHRRFATLLEKDPVRLHRAFTVLVLLNSVVVGVIAGLAPVLPSLAPGYQELILVGGMICTAATVTLAIDPVLRVGIPIAILAPFAVGLVFALDTANALHLVFVACYVGYLSQTTRRVHDDFWNAQARGAELTERADQLKRLSETDALTQVANRLHLDRELHAAWARSHREQDRLSVLLVDVDHFKAINDRFGHPAGDRCLREIAGALVGVAQRDADLVARWGGEEFLVLLPGTDLADATVVAERMRTAVAAVRIDVDGTELRATCSIGVAGVHGAWMAEHGPATAVAMADAALYRAKQDGRDRVEAVSA